MTRLRCKTLCQRDVFQRFVGKGVLGRGCDNSPGTPSVGVDGESGPVSMARYERVDRSHSTVRACYSVDQHPWQRNVVLDAEGWMTGDDGSARCCPLVTTMGATKLLRATIQPIGRSAATPRLPCCPS